MLQRAAARPAHPRTADKNARPSRVASDGFVSEEQHGEQARTERADPR